MINRLPSLMAALTMGGFLLSLSAPAWAQSLDVKNPQSLPQGITKATIDSFGNEQFWTFTYGPGHFHLSFSRSDAKEGFNVGAKAGIGAVIAPKVMGSTMSFKESAQGTVYDGDAKSPTRVIVMIEPPKSPLVRQTFDYTLMLDGATGGAVSSSGGAASEPSVVGVYNMFVLDGGAAKFKADGTISTSGDATGTWECFDQSTETYTIKLGTSTYSATYQPGRGFIDKNNVLLFQRKP